MQEELNQNKMFALEESLSVGMTSVYLDSRVDGVSLPDHLMGQPRVILNLSYLFKCRVFDIDSAGVRASLSFGGKEFLCVIPWESVYLLHLANPSEEDEQGALFWESIPDVMRSQFEALAAHLGVEDALLSESDAASPELITEGQQPSSSARSAEAEHDPDRGILSFNQMQKK